MNKIFTFITMLIAMLTVSIAIPLHAEETTTPTWVGQGTSDSPYEISSKEHLQAITTQGLSSHYKLTGNITLTGDWTPIGTNSSNPFTGTFDGGGHVISGLNVAIDKVDSQNGGLFGFIGANGTVKNLGVTGTVSVTTTGDYANAHAGGIAGQSNGKIMNCYTNVTVNATSSSFIYAGGIAGYMAADIAAISNCFATGNCTATSTGTKNAIAGGILGGTSGKGSISYCFATGTVEAKGTASTKYAGGIAGQSGTAMTGCIALNKGITGASGKTNRIAGKHYEGSFANCYASPAISGTWSDKGANLIDGADLTEDNFISKGANEGAFTGWSADNWDFTTTPANLPTLKVFKANQPVKDITRESVMTKPLITTIATADDLANFRDAVNEGESYNGKTVTLTAEIDLSSIDNWTPIGNSSNPFAGIFEGSGHYINGLNVAISETTGNQYGGLFGYIDTGGTVQNLGVTGGAVSVTITDSYSDLAYAGGIAGLNNGAIKNCYTTVNVTANGGTSYAGGISGDNEGTISNCYTTGDITSDNRAGGINSYGSSGSISNCFATGKVEGGNYATGIADKSVTNCIALNKKGITSNADNTDDRQYRVSTTEGTNNYASPAIPGTWSKIGATAQDGADLTEDNFISKGANEGAFTGWSGDNWEFGDKTNLPKLKTTTGQVIAGQAATMPTRTNFLEGSIEISAPVTYDAETHKDKNIIVKSGGAFTIATSEASLKKLTIEDGGEVVASNTFTCKELLAPRTLSNQWTAYGSPVEMKAVAGTSQTFHKLSGYTGTQAWDTAESTEATSYDISKLNLIATETAADVSVTLTASMSGSDLVSIPADKPGPTSGATTGETLNTGIFLFCANPTLKDVMIPVAYILSEDGTRFEQKKDAVVKPFQSYIVANAVTSAAVMSLRAGEVPTANEPVALPDDSFRLWGTNGQFHLSADRATDIEVYNLNGQLLHRFTLTGSRTLTLPRGVYLVRSNNITYKVSL